MAEKSCSSCGHEELEPGFLDAGDHPGHGRWIAGELRTGVFGGAKVFGKARLDVHAYRCTRCSHLDLFAVEPSGY
jgi:hypothetical protein